MQQADLLIALGSRFDDRVTGKVGGFAPDAKIIHVDIDPAELGKVRRPDVPIVGDCRLVIEELVVGAQATCSTAATPHARPRRRGSRPSAGWQEKYPLTYEQSEPGDAAQAAVRARAAARPRARGHASSPAASASTRCGRRSTGSSTTPTPG